MRSIAPYILAAMLACMTPATSFAQEQPTEDELLGEWVLPGNGSVIRAYRCGDTFCDANVKVEPPKRWDSAPRRRVPGILIPSNLRQQGPRTWHGKLYNIRDGDTYEGTINLIDKNRLSFVRCLIGSVLCDTKIFYRSDPPSVAAPPIQQRVVSRDRLEVATPPQPTAKTKSKIAARPPTRADFEAFLKERGIASVPTVSAPEQQILFKDFMAWRSKRQ